MLTDLSFLEQGQVFPPVFERDRLNMYANNRALFEGRHSEVYFSQMRRIQRIIGNFEDVISFAVVLNYPKKISLKTADLLFGEAPSIISGEAGSPEQKAVESIAETSDLLNVCYETAIDVSRYGDGLLYVRRGYDGRGVIDIAQPRIWFPVVKPDNIKEVMYHVIAWMFTTGTMEKGNQKHFLKVQIHERGKVTERLHSMSGAGYSAIGGLIETNAYTTGLSDFAIIPISNVSTSDNYFGYDDYSDIDSVLAELEVRISQVAKILDAHASPSMQGPPTAAVQENGKWKVKPGNYFTTVNGEKIEYLTWDGQLDASFKQIEALLNQLYNISEMGSALWGDMKSSSGEVPSGTALRRLMISALAKVNRIKMRFDPALKKAIKLCSELYGVQLQDVSITWQDGLPVDDVETANILNIRTGAKATMSIHTALKKYDGLTDVQVEEEAARIEADNEAANSIVPPVFGGQ